MARLTPDARIPRWIALGYAALAIGVLSSAVGAYAYLGRREEARLREDLAVVAADTASRLGQEFRSLLSSLPERGGDPYPEPLVGFFAEAVVVGGDGRRTFPPIMDKEMPIGDGPGMELVEEADRMARTGREIEALELYEFAGRDSTPGVRWSALMGMGAIYERAGRPELALTYLSRAASLAKHPVHRFTAWMRRAEVLAGTGDAARAKLEYGSLLEDLASACESWVGGDPEPLGPNAVGMLVEKATSGLRALAPGDGDLSMNAIARIGDALDARRGVDATARVIAAARAEDGFLAVEGEPPDGGGIGEGCASTPYIVYRRVGENGIEAFRLRWLAWEERMDELCDGLRVGRIPLRFDLVPPGGTMGHGLSATSPLGPPPLDAILVRARPAEAGTADAVLAGSRFRVGLVVGALALLFLVAMGLGARNLARAATLARARAEFALSTSHEIKTPLTLIRAAAETLAVRDLDGEARKPYLRTLVVESRRLSDLVGKVLDMSRLEGGPVLQERSPQDLAELGRDAIRSFEPILVEAGMDCRLEAPEPVPVLVDPEAIINAALALLDNAIRYTPPDAGPERRRIDVCVRRDGGQALLGVADRGIGIPPEEREMVFERYYRVRSELFHEVRGAGLGLSIVRQIIQAHGGAVRIEGNEPFGTVVRLWLPLEGEGHGET